MLQHRLSIESDCWCKYYLFAYIDSWEFTLQRFFGSCLLFGNNDAKTILTKSKNSAADKIISITTITITFPQTKIK